MTEKADWYLASTEDDHFSSPQKCWRVRRLHGETRDDWLLVGSGCDPTE